MNLLTPALCRAGRALVDWTQDELAKTAGVSRSTVREFEKGHHALQRSSEEAIVFALASAGVEILSWRGGGPGVRFRSIDRQVHETGHP
jgi:DNA-binding XRE family transcriptional regulator